LSDGDDFPRVGLLLGFGDIDRLYSLSFVVLGLIREWSRMFPGKVTVFYRSSDEGFLKTVEGFSDLKGQPLRRLADVCRYRHDVDVLYTPYWWSEIAIEGLPQVHFIPDVAYALYPELQPRVFVEGFILACKRAVGISKFIIGPSEYTKKTLVDLFRVSGENIRVVYHGVHEIFSDDGNRGIEPEHMPHGASDYLFYPSSSLKRKNHIGLLDALVYLREHHRFEPYCIMTGDLDHGFHSVEIRNEIVRRGLSRTVHHLGQVSLSEIRYLYANAKALVFPSLFEGFGLPVLEAMTVGCPVIASHLTSIPEVAGDTALYFDPQEPSDMAQALLRFYQEPSLGEALVPAARLRARSFSERRYATEVFSVLRDAYSASKADVTMSRVTLKRSVQRVPLLTVILLFQRSAYREIAEGMASLRDQVGDTVEFVWIVPPRDAQRPEVLALQDKRVFLKSDFHRSIAEAVEKASAVFVLFSRGDALPLASFVSFLAHKEDSAGLKGDFFDGEIYFKDRRSHALRSSVEFSVGGEHTRDHCSHYLPFVVRSARLLGALSSAGPPIRSFSELALRLFDTCTRKRLFVPVCAKVARVRPRENPQSAILLERIAKEFVTGRAVSRVLGLPVVRSIVLRSFDWYLDLPQSVREYFRRALMPVWRRPTQE
jgi:glycosyltransferase involved in cell wall biosynthesis